MLACFIELAPFERLRERYLDDDAYARLQTLLQLIPDAGDLIEGTGGLRKLRFADKLRGKGKRGGLRVIYYYWAQGPEFWLVTIYSKHELVDLSPKLRAALREYVKSELKARRMN
jgi:hypothetical protein